MATTTTTTTAAAAAEQFLMEGLMSLLECPVCYDTPRPGTRGMAMCKSGHTVCQACFDSIEEASMVIPAPCPQCRDTDFRLYSNNFLFSNLADFLMRGRIFKCAHDPCPFQGFSNEVANHEPTCPWIPVYCMKWHCNYRAPFPLMLQQHKGCMTTLPLSTSIQMDDVFTKYGWECTVNFTEFFDTDFNCLSLDVGSMSRLLHHPKRPDFRAYFQPIRLGCKKMQMCLGWLGKSSHASQDIQDMEYHLSVISPTRFGEMGASSKEKFWFSDHIACYYDPEPGRSPSVVSIKPLHKKVMHLQLDKLSEWLTLSPRDICTLCQSDISTKGPHLHVYIEIVDKH